VRLGEGAQIGMHAAILVGAQIAPGEVVAPYETRSGDQDTRAPRRSA
jgi:hypothetical protein